MSKHVEFEESLLIIGKLFESIATNLPEAVDADLKVRNWRTSKGRLKGLANKFVAAVAPPYAKFASCSYPEPRPANFAVIGSIKGNPKA